MSYYKTQKNENFVEKKTMETPKTKIQTEIGVPEDEERGRCWFEK